MGAKKKPYCQAETGQVESGVWDRAGTPPLSPKGTLDPDPLTYLRHLRFYRSPNNECLFSVTSSNQYVLNGHMGAGPTRDPEIGLGLPVDNSAIRLVYDDVACADSRRRGANLPFPGF